VRDERGDQASSKDASQAVLGLWIVLVIVLILLGVAGAESYALLQEATRLPTTSDLAASVCTAYTTQNYQLLIDQIDPTPVAEATTTPGVISSTGAFDTTAQSQLISDLKALDKSAGTVTSCQQSQILVKSSPGNSSTKQFVFLMQRSKVTYSLLMNFVQRGGVWKVARDSNFIGVPG
jgi:hypothetical protein